MRVTYEVKGENLVIKYGLDIVEELKFASFDINVERRNEMWIDIILKPKLLLGSELPGDLIDFDILVITSHEGVIAQIVPQDVGCDCEYQFTMAEKEQIKQYIQSEEVQAFIQNCANKK